MEIKDSIIVKVPTKLRELNWLNDDQYEREEENIRVKSIR